MIRRSSTYVIALIVSSSVVVLPYRACAQSVQSIVERMASPFISKSEYDSLREDLRRQNEASSSAFKLLPPQFHGVTNATAAALAEEHARANEVSQQVETDRIIPARTPSAEFLATEARFDDARKLATPVPKAQVIESTNTPQVQEDAPAKSKPLTAEQQELLRLEVAECQRSGRTPDQLTPAEIAVFKAKAGIQE